MKPMFFLIICVLLVSCKTTQTSQYTWMNEMGDAEKQAVDEKQCQLESEKHAGEKPRKEPEEIFRPLTGRGRTLGSEIGGRQRNRIALEEWESKKNSQYEKCMKDRGYIKSKLSTTTYER